MRAGVERNLPVSVLAVLGLVLAGAATAPVTKTGAARGYTERVRGEAADSGGPVIGPYEVVRFNRTNYTLHIAEGNYLITVDPEPWAWSSNHKITVYDGDRWIGFARLRPGMSKLEIDRDGRYRVAARGAGSFMILRNNPANLGDSHAHFYNDTFVGRSGYWVETSSEKVDLEIRASDPLGATVYFSDHRVARRLAPGTDLRCICPNSLHTNFRDVLYVTLTSQVQGAVDVEVLARPVEDGSGDAFRLPHPGVGAVAGALLLGVVLLRGRAMVTMTSGPEA